MKNNKIFSLGFGIGTKNLKGKFLEVFYYKPLMYPSNNIIDTISKIIYYKNGNTTINITQSQAKTLSYLLKKIDINQSFFLSQISKTKKPLVLCILMEDTDITSTQIAYLKLHLLSHRVIKPNNINLNNIFNFLPNVAWTNVGAIDVNELASLQIKKRIKGKILEVFSIDKFPKMTNYVVPSGVRIADSARIRLGAYIGKGTTVMHEGFINFNAGTEGPNMVEGRISSGVFVAKNTDLGGGCSTMGILSGGNNNIISVGENCLIGANAGTGISLGNSNIIEAGLYLTATCKVAVCDTKNKILKIVKAVTLENKPNLLFRRNSQNGIIECIQGSNYYIKLNSILHNN